MDKKRLVLNILAVIGIVILAFLVLTAEYFWAQLNYIFHNTPQQVEKPVNDLDKSDPNLLTIESLGIQAPVQYSQTTKEKEFQTLLIDGVVHYPKTANPGEVGNVYIFGHSSDYVWSKGKYKTVFALLPKIEIGAFIKLSDDKGNLFVYKVVETKVVSPTDLSVLNQETGGRKILTVQTSYPVGTALKRFLAIAEIVQ